MIRSILDQFASIPRDEWLHLASLLFLSFAISALLYFALMLLLN
jgi:hypothetical protein